jgi:hypothetical protein
VFKSPGSLAGGPPPGRGGQAQLVAEEAAEEASCAGRWTVAQGARSESASRSRASWQRGRRKQSVQEAQRPPCRVLAHTSGQEAGGTQPACQLEQRRSAEEAAAGRKRRASSRRRWSAVWGQRSGTVGSGRSQAGAERGAAPGAPPAQRGPAQRGAAVGSASRGCGAAAVAARPVGQAAAARRRRRRQAAAVRRWRARRGRPGGEHGWQGRARGGTRGQPPHRG